jgi:hypothetical protein
MIECLPNGVCSWNYSLRGDGHRAELEFAWAGESGAMVVDGARFVIEKGGMLSGLWNLRRGGKVVARGEKRNAFQRSFDVMGEAGRFELGAESFAGRTMVMSGGGCRAVMAPHHPFTRRATIEGRLPEFEMVCFGFWLTVLTWRRAASHAAAG